MRTVITAIALVLAGCSPTPAAVTPAAAAEPHAFDAAFFQSNFVEGCKDPAVADELLCLQVQVAGMSAEGDLLRVPTTLNAAAQGQGAALCEQLALAHFGWRHLGYRHIGVMDQNGNDLAACSVD